MKWSIAFAFLGVIALLTILSHFESESPRSVSPQAPVEVEIDQLLLTRYDEEGKKLEESSAVRAIRLEEYSTTHFSELEVRRHDRHAYDVLLLEPVHPILRQVLWCLVSLGYVSACLLC